MIKSPSFVPHFLAVASILLCVVSSAKAQGKVLLRMNLHPGQTFDQAMKIEANSSETIQNKRIDTTTTTQFGLHNEVLAVDDDGNMKLKMTYQTITLKIQGTVAGKAILPQSYDSQSPPKDIPVGLKPIAALAGLSLISTISPQGKVIKVEGLDSIIQQMMSGIKDPQQRAAMQKNLTQTLDSTIKSSMEIVLFPEAAVAIGDSWTNVVSASAPMQIATKYTFISSQNGIATLAVSSNFSPNPNAPALDMSQFKMKSSISGTQNGEMHVDEKTGLAIDSEFNQRMKDVVSISVSKGTSKDKPNPAMPSSLIVYIKNTMRTWTIKLPQ